MQKGLESAITEQLSNVEYRICWPKCKKCCSTVPNPSTVVAVPHSTTAAAPTSRGRGRPKSSKEKNVGTSRPRMIGMRVLHPQSGQTIINPGLPSEKVKNTKSSAVVTCDLGHKATSGGKNCYDLKAA
ncbi:hypothetical protein K7X08_006059 [Anisodus acutangulus]|uniref:Uncharacterized protein n=1 Tax=Anisodus acutangulus TaxID=402998 RepID=A0A9Q1LVS6_9SOLA|nr:hypothetical protein K7X08_006059 [Anisodus acutangulus]